MCETKTAENTNVKGAVLKPCPFCGGPASLKKSTFHKGRWLIECNRSECNYTYGTALEAQSFWNSERPLEAENARLKEKLDKYIVVEQILNKAIPEFLAENFIIKP